MRKLVLFLLLAALFSVTLTVGAQDTAPAFCGELPESDCTILTDAQTTMTTNQSGSFDLDINLTVSDIEGFTDPLIFNLAGTGAYSGNLSGLMSSSSMPMQTMTDPAAMVQMLGDVLGSFSGELDLTLTIPETFVGMVGEESAGGIPLQLRLVDGVGYLNFEPLRELLGAQAGEQLPEGWGGIDLVGVITSLSESGMLDNMSQTGMDAETMQAFTSPDFLNQFVTVTRAEDATLEDGANVAVFNTSIDYGALAASDEFNELMQQSMESQGSNLTEEQMESTSAMMAEAFQNITLNSTTYVGLEDSQIVRQQTIAVINLQGMLGAMGDEDDAASAPTLTLEATVNYGGFNEAQEITAPEDAPVLTAEDLMGGMSMDSESDAMMMTPTPTAATSGG
jgi:hypothetical protein